MNMRPPPTLVCLFLRGGMDGLMAVTPYTDPVLSRLRPNLMLPPPGSDSERALLRLDDRFGLHPSFAPLLPFFQDGRLAVVHGVGSPERTRSHFDQQEYLETGTPGLKGTKTGWVNRALALRGDGKSPLRAIAVGKTLPRALYGQVRAVAVDDLSAFGLRVTGKEAEQDVREELQRQYRKTDKEVLRRISAESFMVEDMLRPLRSTWSQTTREIGYPVRCLVGERLRQVGLMIKADLGVEAAWIDYATADWDTHANQHGSMSAFARHADGLARSLAAFYDDLGDRGRDVVVLTMTEFGRTVAQNGSCGTDHGRASCFFLIGEGVRGGRVYGDVPILTSEALDDGRDLPVTTDYRAVFAEVAAQLFDVADHKELFPDWTGDKASLFRVKESV